MTVNDFIKNLQNLKPELREKEIVILCSNGLMVEPKIKQQPIDPYNIFGGSENVKNIVISSE